MLGVRSLRHSAAALGDTGLRFAAIDYARRALQLAEQSQSRQPVRGDLWVHVERVVRHITERDDRLLSAITLHQISGRGKQ